MSERRLRPAVVVDMTTTGLRLLDNGRMAAPSDQDGPTAPPGETPSGSVVVEPAPGVQAGLRLVRMTHSSRHRGERHLDGDELLYLMAGAAAVQVLTEDGKEHSTCLRARQAAIVLQRTWHRVVISEPSQLLFHTPGRTEVRPAQRQDDAS